MGGSETRPYDSGRPAGRPYAILSSFGSLIAPIFDYHYHYHYH